MINGVWGWYQILAVLAVLLLLCILIGIISYFRKKAGIEKQLYEKIFNSCKEPCNINQTIGGIFRLMSAKIKANEYGFYLLDGKNGQFVLKSIHYKNESDDNLNLSYSGLIPHKDIKYVFPVALGPADIAKDVGVLNEAKTKIAYVRIRGGKALIQLVVGSSFKMDKNTAAALKNVSERLESVIQCLIEAEIKNTKAKILETSQQATKSITSMISGDGILKMAVSMFTKTINAKGGFFLKRGEDGYELEVNTGFSKETGVMFKYDAELHGFLYDFLGSKKLATLNVNDSNFSIMPIYLIAEGVKQILLFRIDYADNVGIAGFWYDQPYEIDEYQTVSLLLMFSKISDVFGKTKQLSRSCADNIETLKLISTLVDDLSPYTVGFSSLMQKYATLIAEHMRLPKEEVDEIALAAFLSNIGIAALSYDVFLKKGKYTEFDYEIIKLHSEVGADIIESLQGQSRAADMVRYHHERIDGCGYPYGLKGDDIPIGAKILAVAQFFIAKISPRNFRDASTYDEALAAIESAAGTQLDKDVVDNFLSCVANIRNEHKYDDGSLDYCWNMRFVSSELCNKCPVKVRTDRKCWESSATLCVAHGNKCETCFIYTEYQGRMNKN